MKVKTATTAKLADKGVQCMFIGYATNSGGDVWNPITNRVNNTRDVIWLKRMYFKPQDDANEDEVDVDDMIVEQEQITGQGTMAKDHCQKNSIRPDSVAFSD